LMAIRLVILASPAGNLFAFELMRTYQLLRITTPLMAYPGPGSCISKERDTV
jgi:hypothetical protein